MAGISAKVSVEAIDAGIKCCQSALEELGGASRGLSAQFNDVVARGWRDDRPRQVGELVKDCCTSLNHPMRKLEEHIATLQKLKQVIIEIENQKIL